MSNRTLDSLRQASSGRPAGGGHKVMKSFTAAVSERVTPAFHAPMTWLRVKESLWCSGVFPLNAELTVQGGAGNAILVDCSWLLLDDPEQPERRSTPIKIVIQGELAYLFHNADAEMLKQLDEALAREVIQRMKRYQVDLGLPYHRRPPPFEIRVGLGLMSRVGRRRKLQVAE